MRPRSASRLAWPLWGLTAGVMVPTTTLLFLNIEDALDLLAVAANVALVMGLATVGALIASRRSANPIGWILCAMGFAFAISSFVEEYLTRSLVSAPGSLPQSVFVLWLYEWFWGAAIAPISLVFLLFPTGRLLTPRWTPVAWIAVVAPAVSAAGFALRPGLLQDSASEYGVRFVNPVGIPVLREAIDEVLVVGAVASLAAALASVVALVLRFRRARGEERQQIKWLAYVGATAAIFLIATFTIEPLGGSTALGDLGFMLLFSTLAFGIPAAIGFAMLRYRLYDIDRIINRTLVYVILTALLIGIYAGAAVGLGTLVRSLTGQENNAFVIASSTLSVAALFGPVRRRVQGFIDRRFYRKKYDAARTLEAFSARLREEVDLDSLTGELVGVVRSTMQPVHVSLWLRSASVGPSGPDEGVR
jgi:hypothetical protein